MSSKAQAQQNNQDDALSKNLVSPEDKVGRKADNMKRGTTIA